MGGKMSRDKGLNFERRIAQELRGIFPNAKRHLESQAEEALGYDLDCTEPFLFQCKRNKKYAPISKIEEIQLERDNSFHVLITKGDKKPTVAVMFFDDFKLLLHNYIRSFDL